MVQADDPQHIILNPADDYVTDFIQDINRARVLQVGTVMDTKKKPKTGPEIPHDMVMEDALKFLTGSSKTGRVTKKRPISVRRDRRQLDPFEADNGTRSGPHQSFNHNGF